MSIQRLALQFALIIPVLSEAAPAPVPAHYPCWVLGVLGLDDGVHVQFSKEYIWAIRGIEEPTGSQSQAVVRNGDTVTLVRGEKLLVSTIPDDQCTITATSIDGVEGVQFEAAYCARGKCRRTSKFVPGAE